MGQIIKNYMLLFIVPFLIGAAVRLLCRRAKRACLIAPALTALAVASWIATYAIPSHGSELYGIIALQVTSTAAGALLAGLAVHLKMKRMNRKRKY